MKRLALVLALITAPTAAFAVTDPVIDPSSCATAQRLLNGRIRVQNLLIFTPNGVVRHNGATLLEPNGFNGGLGSAAYDLVRQQCFANL